MLRRSLRFPLFCGGKLQKTVVTATSPLCLQSHRQISLMPVFEVAVELIETALVTLHASTSLQTAASAITTATASSTSVPLMTPILAIFAFGFLVRLTSLLTFTMYSDRAQDRYATAMPTLSKNFLLYAEVAWNPHALKNEVEMAATKLKERRTRAMKKFKTSNLRVWAGTLASMTCVGGAGLIGIAAAPTCFPLAELNGAANLLVSSTIFSSIPVIGSALPTVTANAVGTAIVLYNFENYTTFRKGFWDQRDELLEKIRARVRIAAGIWVLLFSLSSFFTFQKYLTTTMTPSPATGNNDENTTKKEEQQKVENKNEKQQQQQYYEFSHGQLSVFILLPFFILGSSIAGLLRFHVCHKVAKTALSSVLQWPRKRPKLHGTYGEYRWNYAEHLGTVRWAEVHTGEKKRAFENYDRAKVQLEYECDARLSKMPMFKNIYIDSRYARKPNMPAAPEDLAVVRGGGGNQPELPEGVELKLQKREK